MGIAVILHALAAVIWVGVFGRFFTWVWLSHVTLLGTGFWMIGMLDGFKAVGMHVHGMLALGIVMMLILLHVFFAAYKRMKLAVAAEEKFVMTSKIFLGHFGSLSE